MISEKIIMKKYEAPVVELEIFNVGEVMTSYEGGGSEPVDPPCTDETPLF